MKKHGRMLATLVVLVLMVGVVFAGCDKQLMIMDAITGKIVAKVSIGDGCDGVAFDNHLKDIFASCGEGTLTVIHESAPSAFNVVASVATKRSARTLALDEKDHKIFLPAAGSEKFEVLVIARH